MAVYREIQCKTACSRLHSRFLPFHWDLNAYRGCTHGCRYCYALYSHQYLGSHAFYREVFVKTNAAERLERQLCAPSWDHAVVNLGGVTDSYQPAESQYRLMADILKLLIRYRTPCTISTKSALILRDYDLFAELARVAGANIAVTVTTMDEAVRRELEPGAFSSERRLDVIRAFSKTGVSTGIHLMPIVPLLTDSAENLEAIYASARDAGADYVLPGLLNLRGRTRDVFFQFLCAQYPTLLEPIGRLYGKGSASPDYKAGLFQKVGAICASYGLAGGHRQAAAPCGPQDRQLSFF